MTSSRPAAPNRALVPLLVGLLSVRLLYLGAGRLITWPDYPQWLLPSEQIATYLLIALLIYVCRPHLAHYHFTKLALALFLLAPLLNFAGLALAELNLNTDLVVIASELAISAVLSVILLRQRSAALGLGNDTVRGLVIALAVGFGLGIAFGTYFLIEQFGRMPPSGPTAPFSDGIPFVIGLTLVQLAGAAILEEPLFRGFGWGALRDWGLRDPAVLILQALLFAVSHIYYVKFAPISFWIIVPTVGLVLGLLAWRTRSIATTIIAHALVNAVAISWSHT